MKKLLATLAATLLLAACSGGGADPAAAPASAAPETAAPAPAAPVAPQDANAVEPAPTPQAEPEAAEAPAAADDDAAPAAPEAAPEAAAAAVPAWFAQPIPAPANSGNWVEGTHYFRIDPQQARLDNNGKVEVVEVFSYGCPACFQSHGIMQRLASSLPDYAQMDYLPVSFRPDENWPVYQRAWYTADAFGVAYEAHDAMFDAIWKGERKIGTYDGATGRPKPKAQWPGIEDIATFYADWGVDPAEFVATANSFAINTRMKRADQTMKNWMVSSTPTVVIDGKYRITPGSAGSYDKFLQLAQWLVQKEGHEMQRALQRHD